MVTWVGGWVTEQKRSRISHIRAHRMNGHILPAPTPGDGGAGSAGGGGGWLAVIPNYDRCPRVG